ncbi:hypothetical protein PUNSTDRAFT_123673, partial [Punctularia strigosozonata HHB-11173 SS5]|uniref:uncharacterized protein n=1 Tax=Punctularia strigosozonata (strain HHB-11173) TaxID=741275 RepID=UPI0004417C47
MMQSPHDPANDQLSVLAFPEIDFTFDPTQFDPALFPPPPPLPASADLFTPSEATDFFGFLDTLNFELDPEQNLFQDDPALNPPRHAAPYSNPHTNTAPEPSAASKRTSTRPSSSRGVRGSSDDVKAVSPVAASPAAPFRSPPSLSDIPEQPPQPRPGTAAAIARQKPLLSTPQKRLNHIMSEQKRRNAIRDGYAQLISLLTPAGAQGEIMLPTRGRPKGSGSRSKGRGQGKSGVLFRAVEYCKWLEEGRDALKAEMIMLYHKKFAPC